MTGGDAGEGGGDGGVDGGSDPAGRVEVDRVLAFSPDVVFDAWLDPEGMAEWMCPGPATRAIAVELEPRVGGSFRIEMDVEGTLEVFEGRYRVIERPSRLVFTWRAARTEGRSTEVLVRLLPHPSGTRLVLVHEQLPTAGSRDAHRAGWTAILAALEAFLTRL